MADDKPEVVLILPPDTRSADERRNQRARRNAEIIQDDPKIDVEDDEELVRLALVRAGYVLDDQFE